MKYFALVTRGSSPGSSIAVGEEEISSLKQSAAFPRQLDLSIGDDDIALTTVLPDIWENNKITTMKTNRAGNKSRFRQIMGNILGEIKVRVPRMSVIIPC